MKTLLSIIISVFYMGSLYAQSTTIQLPTADSSSSFRVLKNTGSLLMRLNADNGFYLGGIEGTGNIPTTGPGTRLMWYPAKAAFRVGTINGTHWDDASIGSNSVAMGYNITASGFYSVAMGYETIASGSTSTAMGGNTTASGGSSTAMGTNTIASGGVSTAMGGYTTAIGSASIATGWTTTAIGDYSTAMGNNTTASGGSSTAMGNNTTASGGISTAMGSSTIASAYASTAMGYHTQVSATGSYSTAIGNYVKANHTGAVIIGDRSKTALDSSSVNNQMTMRFDGGYRFFSNSACTLGVYMNHNETAWTAICDRNKKENFNAIDGEQILAKIKEMPITEWNYKGTDPNTKYIGPVAQDFYSAFHLGGTDSLGINTLCIDGVNIAAIQALEKRTAELQKANEKIAQLENQLMQQKAEQEKINAILIDRIEKLSVSISSPITNK